MSYFDIALLAILAIFTFNGLRKGLIRLLGQFVGLIVAAYVSSHFYLNFYDWAKGFVDWGEGTEKFLAFIILFTLVSSIIGVVFIIIEKVFNLISIIPFTKLINRLLGGVLGLFEGALALGLILFVAARYTWVDSLMGNQLAVSTVAPSLVKVADILLPFLPEALKVLSSVIG